MAYAGNGTKGCDSRDRRRACLGIHTAMLHGSVCGLLENLEYTNFSACAFENAQVSLKQRRSS